MVTVSVEALDGTSARSVTAFLEGKHAERFPLADPGTATVVLVDLDQPGARDAIDGTSEGQVVIGVGFDAEPRVPCWSYLQKPLTGDALLDELAQAMVRADGTRLHADRPARSGRSSRARDVFWADATEPTLHRRRPVTTHHHLDREVHQRVAVLQEGALEATTVGGTAEALGRSHEIEPIPARDGGDLSDPATLAGYRYRPERHLTGGLTRARADHPDQGWTLAGPGLTLVGDPGEDAVTVAGDERSLRRICAGPLGPGWHVKGRPAPRDRKAGLVLPMDVVCWNVAVWCSAGRLPAAVDPFGPVRMTAWPDLTRVVRTPSVMPVIALLTAGAWRPVDVVEELGLSRTHVFVVVAAAHALGLLEHATALNHDGRRTTADRHVLRRLVGRLRAA